MLKAYDCIKHGNLQAEVHIKESLDGKVLVSGSMYVLTLPRVKIPFTIHFDNIQVAVAKYKDEILKLLNDRLPVFTALYRLIGQLEKSNIKLNQALTSTYDITLLLSSPFSLPFFTSANEGQSIKVSVNFMRNKVICIYPSPLLLLDSTVEKLKSKLK